MAGVAIGAASPAARRAVCYCRDCRMFAHFLGRAETILDRHGGTEALLLSQARLRIDRGHERLACMRLTPRGLLRWYTTCCQTPLGNVLAQRRLPYLGLLHAGIDYDALGATPDQVHGPVGVRIHGRHIEGAADAPAAARGIPLGAALALGARVLGWSVRGDHRRSPLFDPATGAPVAEPRVLTTAEWRELAARATGEGGG